MPRNRIVRKRAAPIGRSESLGTSHLPPVLESSDDDPKNEKEEQACDAEHDDHRRSEQPDGGNESGTSNADQEGKIHRLSHHVQPGELGSLVGDPVGPRSASHGSNDTDGEERGPLLTAARCWRDFADIERLLAHVDVRPADTSRDDLHRGHCIRVRDCSLPWRLGRTSTQPSSGGRTAALIAAVMRWQAGAGSGNLRRVPDDSESTIDYFRRRGFDVRIEERDLHADHMARGEPGRAAFYADGRTYFLVDLVRDGETIAPHYADGDTVESALMAAKRRFGSEQE